MENDKKELEVSSIQQSLSSNKINTSPSETTKDDIELLEPVNKKDTSSDLKIESSQVAEVKPKTTSDLITIQPKTTMKIDPLVVTETKREENLNTSLITDLNANTQTSDKTENKQTLADQEKSIDNVKEPSSTTTNTKQKPITDNPTEKSLMNSTANNESTDKKTKNRHFAIIILSVLLVLLVALGYKIYLGNSLVLFKTVLNRGYNEFSDLLYKSNEKSLEYNYNEPIIINGNLKINSNIEELSNYSNYNYDFNIGFDPAQEKMNLELAMNKENEAIIDGLFYFTQNILYIKANKAYPQTLYLDLGTNIFESLNQEESKPNYDYKDIDKLVEKMTGYLKKAVNEENFIKKQEKLNIDGQEISVTKHTYKIDSNEAYNLTKSIHKDMTEDQEFIDIIAKITSMRKSEVEEMLNDYKINKEDYADMDEINFYIYTTGFFPKLLGIGLSGDQTNITYTSQTTQGVITIVSGTTTINATIKDGVITGNVQNDSQIFATFKVKIEDKTKSNKVTVEFEVTENSTKATVILENKKINDKQVESAINVNISINESTDPQKVDINLKYNAELGRAINEINTDEALDINTLTEEDKLQLWTNIQNTTIGTPLEYLFITESSYDEPYEDYTMYRLEEFTNAFKILTE